MADLNWKDAIEKVLQDHDGSMHYVEIADAIADQDLKRDIGATPAATVASVISVSLRDGNDSPFERVSRGHYRLREREDPEVVIGAEDESDESAEAGLINAFGMYWRRDYVRWKTTPRLLGQQQKGSETVDFCDQRGVYLLHDGRQTVYVGRATDRSLGTRLKEHTVGRLNGRWDRFSWFGIRSVGEHGELCTPRGDFSTDMLVATMEAVLIEGLEPPQNRRQGDGFRAVEFLQIRNPEFEKREFLEQVLQRMVSD